MSKMFWLSIKIGIFLNVVTHGVADSCCGQSNCFESCPWAGSCENGKDFECMNKVSGPFKCRDDDKCRNGYDECDDRQAGFRSGHLCQNFPYYNGGYPMESFK